MPKIKFSKSTIDGIKFTIDGQVIYWDVKTPGLGLVVGARTKTFRLQLDVKDDSRPKGYRTVKKTLGRYGAELTLEQARAMVEGYIDQDGQAVTSERLKLKMDAPEQTETSGKDKLLKELVSDYFRLTKRRDGKERKERTATQYTALVERHYSGWMEMTLPDVADIKPDTVVEKYRSNEVDFGPATARNSSSVLSAILNYGRATYPGALHTNPLAILSNPHLCIRQAKQVRHDCLVYDPAKKRNDFPVFFSGLESCTDTVRDGFLFALYTGMRRAEVEGLQWDNIDLEHKELLLKDTKNRSDLHIPLNRQAMAILERRQTAATNGMVFPQARSGGKNRTGHIQLNALTLKKMTGLDITVHGLRRTFITLGRKLKRFEDTDRLTNHVDSSMSGRHYDETNVSDLRETAQLIGDTIDRYMLESGAKVVRLPTVKAGVAQ